MAVLDKCQKNIPVKLEPFDVLEHLNICKGLYKVIKKLFYILQNIGQNFNILNA